MWNVFAFLLCGNVFFSHSHPMSDASTTLPLRVLWASVWLGIAQALGFGLSILASWGACPKLWVTQLLILVWQHMLSRIDCGLCSFRGQPTRLKAGPHKELEIPRRELPLRPLRGFKITTVTGWACTPGPISDHGFLWTGRIPACRTLEKLWAPLCGSSIDVLVSQGGSRFPLFLEILVLICIQRVLLTCVL
jgi:hypothetical protein